MKITLTGGHLTPALAMVEYLKANHPEVELSFIGRTHNRADQKAVEEAELTHRKVKFIGLVAPKFALVPFWLWPVRLIQLMASVFKASQILKSEQPDCLVSFGGYLAVPIVLAAWQLKIPIVTHEQTRVVGLANRVIGRFARFIGVSFSESQAFFDSKKVKLVGNLIRSSLVDANLPQPNWFKNPQQRPILVITGGSQGSQKINQLVDALLPTLVNQWCVIHQRGPKTDNSQSPPVLPGYFSFEWLTEAELFWLWKQPQAVSISRSGANTVSELAVAKIPAILIPLPNTYQNEQRLNAEWLVKQGGAKILDQDEITTELLATAIDQMLGDAKKIRRELLSNTSQSLNAAAQLWQLICQACSA